MKEEKKTLNNIEYFNRIKILPGYIVQIIVVLITLLSLAFSVFTTAKYHNYFLSFFLFLLMITLLFHSIWIWKFRLFILSPTVRIDKNGILIKRNKKKFISWEDVEKISIIDKVNFTGLLYNIDRFAVVFELKENKKEFIITDKGVFHKEIDQLFSVLKKYASPKIVYKNPDKLEEYKKWIKNR